MTWSVAAGNPFFFEGWGVDSALTWPIFWRFPRADITSRIAPPRGSTIRVQKLRNRTPKYTQIVPPCRDINLKDN